MRKQQGYRWSGYVLVGVIGLLSMLPSKSLTVFHWNQIFGLDKIGHFTLYGATAICFFTDRWLRNYPHARMVPAIALWAYGLLMELLQHVQGQGRNFDGLDLVANFLGIAAAAVCFPKFRQLVNTKP